MCSERIFTFTRFFTRLHNKTVIYGLFKIWAIFSLHGLVRVLDQIKIDISKSFERISIHTRLMFSDRLSHTVFSSEILSLKIYNQSLSLYEIYKMNTFLQTQQKQKKHYYIYIEKVAIFITVYPCDVYTRVVRNSTISTNIRPNSNFVRRRSVWTVHLWFYFRKMFTLKWRHHAVVHKLL